MRLVCTGFEPFSAHDYNPSWDVARGAAERVADASDAVELPVEYEYVRQWAVGGSWREGGQRPDAVVQFGLGETRETIDLESTARNLRGTRADEAGAATDAAGALRPGAPDRLTSNVSIDSLRSSLARRLEPHDLPDVSVSDDAGTYVCNALYFHTLDEIANSDSGDPVPEAEILFVHVPWLEPDDARRVGEIFGAGFGEYFGAGR